MKQRAAVHALRTEEDPTVQDRSLTFITGKGGVGKSVVSAAAGLNLAAAGQRTLICELDDHPAMARIFGVREEIGVEPVRVADKLFVANFRGMPVMKAFLRSFVPSGRITDLLLRNKVASTFFESAPGVMDAVALDRVAEAIVNGGFQRVIIDLPATGHALTLLRLPSSMAEMIGVGELAARVRRLGDLMSDAQRSQLVVVTLPEEMPVNETLEFVEVVRKDVDIRLGMIVVNSVRRMPISEEERRLVDTLATGQATKLPRVSARIRLALRLGSWWHDEDARGVARVETSLESVARQIIPFVWSKGSERDLVEQVAASLRQVPMEVRP